MLYILYAKLNLEVITLGCFTTIELANEAAREYRANLNTFHPESARVRTILSPITALDVLQK